MNMTEDAIYVKFSIMIPATKMLYQFSRAFTSLKLLILSKYLIDEKIGNLLLEISGIKVPDFIQKLKREKKIQAQILSEAETTALINLKMRDPWILDALVKSEILLIYPIQIENGKIYVETFASRNKVDKFFQNLDDRNIDYKIHRLGGYFERPLLTTTQLEVLREAYEQGFYEIPRRVSRKDLAEYFQISKAALSETLRRVHKKLVERFFVV